MKFPKIRLIRQVFEVTDVPDAKASVSDELERTGLLSTVKPGHKVLITAGSRGIESMRRCFESLCGSRKTDRWRPANFSGDGQSWPW